MPKSSFVDPRTDELTHDITEGQVYGDARHEPDDDEEWDDSALYRIVYIDEDTVLMRGNDWTDRTNNRIYQQEPRGVFEEYVGAGRYKLVEDSDHAPPRPNDMQEVINLARAWRDRFQKQGGRIGNHKSEGMEEFLEALQKLDTKPVNVEEVSGVGPQTAEALEEKGLTTDTAILQAEREQLLETSGVGESVADRLIETAEEAE